MLTAKQKSRLLFWLVSSLIIRFLVTDKISVDSLWNIFSYHMTKIAICDKELEGSYLYFTSTSPLTHNGRNLLFLLFGSLSSLWYILSNYIGTFILNKDNSTFLKGLLQAHQLKASNKIIQRNSFSWGSQQSVTSWIAILFWYSTFTIYASYSFFVLLAGILGVSYRY